MTEEQAELIAQHDSVQGRSPRVVTRDASSAEVDAFCPMDAETWNLLREKYPLVSVWHRGQKIQ